MVESAWTRWVGVTIVALAFFGCQDGEPDPVPDCALASDDPRVEATEVSCDGLDNDCDGQVDVLLQVDANRCATGRKGACAFNYFICGPNGPVCPLVPPTHETWDGIDNDCNGVIDDVPQGFSTVSRARVLVPPYLWKEDISVVMGVRNALDGVGIPYDADEGPEDFSRALEHLDEYNLVVMPGYQMKATEQFEDAHLAALEKFVRRGGVLVWFRLVAGESQADMLSLAGLLSAKQRMDLTRVVVSAIPATIWLDSQQERDFRLTGDTTSAPQESFVYLLDAKSKAQPFLYGFAGGNQAGVVGVRRPLEFGAVYTLGVDFLGYTGELCYVNCFDPGRDNLAMLLKGIWREANLGHMVVKHTVPGFEDGVFISSHDVDAPDANADGSWGEAGAIQMAEMEVEEGIKGTYFVTTDIHTDYYHPAMVAGLCKRGMCPEGGHSVLHADWTDFPRGDCTETEASYDLNSPTICGEVRVNLQVLRETLGADAPLRAWRTPYLKISPVQFGVLESEGVEFDSSLAIGDTRSNLPQAAHRFAYDNGIFDEIKEMWTFPVGIEDGIGWFDDKGKEQRLELQAGSWPRFKSGWTDAILKNAANNAWVISLIHPSIGVGVGTGPRNLAYKVEANRWSLQLAKQRGLKVMQLVEAGEFWRGRDGVRVEARYDEDIGYSGRIRVGAYDAPHFSLAFGDQIAAFVAPGAGKVAVSGKRVVFTETLPAHGLYNFKAVVVRPTQADAP